MPWKNGGGETVEIAISPEGAMLSAFDWRVSMATVATDGPFSVFAGIDRTLSVLEGNGMSLVIDGMGPILMTQKSDPLAFPADVAVSASLADGPITDLNVMTRRGDLSHRVERVDIDGNIDVRAADGTFLVLCHSGNLIVDWDDGRAGLTAGDCMLLEDAIGTPVTLTGGARLYLIFIDDA
jgi:environmental stress-induced protein Ves